MLLEYPLCIAPILVIATPKGIMHITLNYFCLLFPFLKSYAQGTLLFIIVHYHYFVLVQKTLKQGS